MQLIPSYNLRYLSTIADQCDIVVKSNNTDFAILSAVCHQFNLILDSGLDALQS